MSANRSPLPARRGAPAWLGRNAFTCGFTLIETLVVLVICVGLVMLMTGLYSAVGKSALALRAGQQEWLVQRQAKEHLLHLFSAEKSTLPPLVGAATEIYLTSWRSRAEALNGEPVLVFFHYAADQRTLYYQEQPLPAWWSGAAAAWDAQRMQAEVRAAPASKTMTGVEDLKFHYLPDDATDLRPEHWVSEWRQNQAPRLVQISFTKAGRHYSLWFATRALNA